MKKMMILMAALMSLNVFAYDPNYDEVVVCDYMATLVKHHADGYDSVYFVNTLLVSDKNLDTGFASAQNIPMKRVEGFYTFAYPTATGSVELYLAQDYYIVSETINGEVVSEVRNCTINNLKF